MEGTVNVVKKYWDSVYLYILLIVPGLCMCAGTYFCFGEIVKMFACILF